MIITTEISKEMMNSTGHEVDVRQSITQVLQDELGLDVKTRYGPPDHLLCNPLILPPDSNLQARRPQDLGLIKVTRESLLCWLQKRGRRSEADC